VLCLSIIAHIDSHKNADEIGLSDPFLFLHKWKRLRIYFIGGVNCTPPV